MTITSKIIRFNARIIVGNCILFAADLFPVEGGSIHHGRVCKNEIQGCVETFPLSAQYCHSTSCMYELIPCPYQGCRAQLLRRDLDTHARLCEHWRQPCHMGCGAILCHRTQAQHNCYKLRQEYEARQRNHRAIATALKRKMMKMQSTMAHMKRQIGLICESLQVMDDLHEVEEEDLGESSGSSSG
ncbi:RING finger protein 151-like [Anarhichas minor]|uniref:RING finger protein 151-like n=1 Tax=Anarhichas minor TaxID=65739 RepID=UPI003F73D4A5